MWLESLTPDQLAALNYDWTFWGRQSQQIPDGEWLTWLILAGRGFGKTRTASESVRILVKRGYGRLALVAETAADARDVIVEGESGILRCSPPWERPVYEPSKRRLTWPNGAIATLYNGTEPDQLRGPQHDAALVDELAKYAYAQETWDQLQFGLRIGARPLAIVTTTPRPIPLIKSLMAAQTTFVTRGRTLDNAENLAASFISSIQERYAGTRLGRQELDAEILDDVSGALWARSWLDASRRKPAECPTMQRVVVAIDPSGTRGDEDDGDSIGIVVAGKGVDGRAYVLADRSCKLSPEGWARMAVTAYREFSADKIIAERNYGGAMVEAVLRSVDRAVPYKEVVASRGKVIRAEPVASLYEQGRVSHVGSFADLEDQMCLFTTDGYMGKDSPDRVDALVWAVSELMLGDSFDLASYLKAYG